MGVRRHVLSADEQSLPHLPLFTLPAKCNGRAIITCDEFYEVDTHFIGRRTLPCMDQNCKACEAKRPIKYEGYVSVVWMQNKRHQILRLTKPAMLQLKSQIPSQNSPRGVALQLQRRGDRPNGQVLVFVEPAQIDVLRLPEPPQLELHLAKIWRIDGIDVASDDAAYVRQLGVWIEEKIELGRANDATQEEGRSADSGVAG